MNKELSTLTQRAKSVEQSVLWWEKRLTEVMDSYETATSLGDKESILENEKELKSLLHRAELEKIEMAKIENEINQACAEAAF